MRDNRIPKSTLYEILEQIEHCTTAYDGKNLMIMYAGLKGKRIKSLRRTSQSTVTPRRSRQRKHYYITRSIGCSVISMQYIPYYFYLRPPLKRIISARQEEIPFSGAPPVWNIITRRV